VLYFALIQTEHVENEKRRKICVRNSYIRHCRIVLMYVSFHFKTEKPGSNSRRGPFFLSKLIYGTTNVKLIYYITFLVDTLCWNPCLKKSLFAEMRQRT
jgi:hypothetical protein